MARTCPFVILSPSSVNMISIFPFTLEIRFAGGFMVVISTVAGTISGYLINPETEITRQQSSGTSGKCGSRGESPLIKPAPQ